MQSASWLLSIPYHTHIKEGTPLSSSPDGKMVKTDRMTRADLLRMLKITIDDPEGKRQEETKRKSETRLRPVKEKNVSYEHVLKIEIVV
ncbi:hypothetical protein RRG08_014423 [Elysia crispata]|uniref:Uncharacterized protein n=1 Tax=Elysia crispata TaxID=231223 RepID=A0AAE0YVL9_9GAST|nr:hypothetical protein RRG08_014423 [Elysia crispata]